MDAKRMESGFSYFEALDFQNLQRGEAIVRIGSSNNDFNLSTKPLNEITGDFSQEIISQTRIKYGTPKKEMEALLLSLLPNINKEKNSEKNEDKNVQTELLKPSNESKTVEKEKLVIQKDAYIKQAKEEETIRKHRALQYFVRTLGTQRGLKATLEKKAINDGKIDVVLENEQIQIPIEIAVTNTVEYELANIQKCIDSGYSKIIVLSEDQKHLEKIREGSKKPKGIDIYFRHPNELSQLLTEIIPDKTRQEKRVRGYRVNTNINLNNNIREKKSITDIIMQSLRKKKKLGSLIISSILSKSVNSILQCLASVKHLSSLNGISKISENFFREIVFFSMKRSNRVPV